MKNNRDLVVKSNQLIQAVSNLRLVEIRLMQLAVVDARETGTGITTDTPLIIWANRYSKTFDVTLEAAYWALKEAARTGVWGVTEQEMHLSPLPAIISTIFPRFNLNMAMPRICLATNII